MSICPRTLTAIACLVFTLMPATVFANGDETPQANEPTVPLPAWELGVRQDLVQREYWVTWQEEPQIDGLPAAWHAPNRAQNLRAYFTPEAVRLIPRTSRTPEWSWSLSVACYGRGSRRSSLEPARLFADENRIRLDRGKLVEWFVNEPKGLKHGFVLQGPPEGAESGVPGDPMHIDLEVGGTLIPSLGADRQSVSFADSSGIGTVYYDGLVVSDATGRPLRSWMETFRSSDTWVVRLIVEDSTAIYPIEIDPLATTSSWTGELDSIDAWFGFQVDTAGDVNGDGYDDVIVGAFHYDNGFVNEGAAFVYHGSPAGPSTTYDWHVEGEEAVAFAGRAVGSAGDVNGDGYDDVIVGVPLINSGRGAWVFHGSATGLSASADWFPNSPLMSGSSFGQAVGSAGDVNGDGYDDVIVGAATHGSPGFNQDGQAYVYHGSATGLAWSPAWSGKGGQDNAAFGIAVGAAGDVNGDGFGDVVVGAYRLADGEEDEGRAFVYHGSAAGLSTTAAWGFQNDVEGACLGGSVSGAGDVNGDGCRMGVPRFGIGFGHESCVDGRGESGGCALRPGRRDGGRREWRRGRRPDRRGSLLRQRR